MECSSYYYLCGLAKIGTKNFKVYLSRTDDQIYLKRIVYSNIESTLEII